ncbi:hypothetical protein E4K65_30020 [Bradyrhizobium niftali]|uniref:Uncharacterized protein n=1 Tax=Bradyrhizobium niftali TaxID=2560055 RepID=A0A4Y9LKB6_9BRAD|nr:hypothetical protein E4K65_30020 [Bradyrhizobium niftali]
MRAQRSNPESFRGDSLDCFAALAMTSGECIAPPFRIPQPSLEYWIDRSSRAMTPTAWRANAWLIVVSA